MNIEIPTEEGGFIKKVGSSILNLFGLRSATSVPAGTKIQIAWNAENFDITKISCTMPDGTVVKNSLYGRYPSNSYINLNTTTTYSIKCEDTVVSNTEDPDTTVVENCVGTPGGSGGYMCINDLLFGELSSENPAPGTCIIPIDNNTCSINIEWGVTSSDGLVNKITKYGGNGTVDVVSTTEKVGMNRWSINYTDSPASFSLTHNGVSQINPITINTVCQRGSSWNSDQDKCVTN